MMKNSHNPEKLNRWLMRMGRSLSPQDASLEEKFKRTFSAIVVTTTAPVLYTYGILHILKNNYFLASFLFLSGLTLTASLLKVRKFKEARHVFRFNMVLVGILFLFLIIRSAPDGYMGLWLYIYPLMAFMLLGRREGMIYTSILFSLMVLYFILQSYFWKSTSHDWGFISRFLFSFGLVSILSYSFELIRDILHQRLFAEQLILSEEREKLAEAKKVAETANHHKSNFLANMSHELRTPLNHILGFTELVVDEKYGDLNEKQKEYLNDVLQSGRHLHSLINDILDLSKVEAGKLELDISKVDIKPLLENSLVLIKEKALNHGIQLSLDLDGMPLNINADERKLKQILYNLLSNAAKFTPDGGQILLKTTRVANMPGEKNGGSAGADGYMEISVEDTGIGIRPEDLERIFRPFEQADSSTSRKYQGTGLGLNLSKSFVELHGGKIWAESEGEGQGSAFRFLIPV